MEVEFKCMLFVDPVGLAGGLAIFWNDPIGVQVVKYAPFCIELKLYNQHINYEWRHFCLYIDCVQSRRIVQFQHFVNRFPSRREDVVFIGDFNALTSSIEKQGGNQWVSSRNDELIKLVEELKLEDLGFMGHQFTWSNKREGRNLIQARLDKGFANQQWLLKYPGAVVKHIFLPGSDHALLLFDTSFSQRKPKQIFRVDNRSLEMEGCREAIRDAWNTFRPTHCHSMASKLKHTQKAILKWRKVHPKCNSKKEIDRISRMLERLVEEGNPDQSLRRNLEKELESHYKNEEEFWRTRSHIEWLALGDRNMAYFHAILLLLRLSELGHGGSHGREW
ncbi:hypothetical protein Sjap_016714 [Stephania japonica]|uniref:Endonuclease/exonuclease/phosphatase domain-containing protein n=1 Tax=Stephania japonica TaxID=461633 RepID=A0AAP0ING7_9MAGN